MIVSTSLGQAPANPNQGLERLGEIAGAFRLGAVALGLFLAYHLYKAGSAR